MVATCDDLIPDSGGRSQELEETGDVPSQQLGLFSSGKVGSARHFGPVLKVVPALDPGPGRKRRLLGEVCDSARWVNLFALLEVERRFLRLVVKATGRMDGLRHPIERHIAEQ